MKFAITFVLLIAVLLPVGGSGVIEKVVMHQKICYHGSVEDLRDDISQLIISIPEEGISNAKYSCSPATYEKAKSISALRPNGSEVFAILWGDLIFDLNICHIHEGETIECGEPLKEILNSF